MPGTSQKSVLLALSRYSPSTHMGVARFASENNWHLNCEMAFTGRLPEGWRGDGIVASLDQREEIIAFVQRAKVPVVDLSVIRPDIEVPRVSGDHYAIGQAAGPLSARLPMRIIASSTRANTAALMPKNAAATNGCCPAVI